MKGIVLAGGLGTRLNPLTEITNKHLLPVGREPMIWHAGAATDWRAHLRDHDRDLDAPHGVDRQFARIGQAIRVRVHVPRAGGGRRHRARAVAMARGFAAGDSLVVLLGDNIFEYSIAPFVDEFRVQERGARVMLKEVGDPERFGVAALDEKLILSIEEKPAAPKSNHAVVGCYAYDERVFDIIDSDRAVAARRAGDHRGQQPLH